MSWLLETTIPTAQKNPRYNFSGIAEEHMNVAVKDADETHIGWNIS